MRALLIGIDSLLEIYCWILIAVSTLRLLSGFNLIDTDKNYLAVINTYLEKATALPLWPVRKILPDLGAVDISPMVLILIARVSFLQMLSSTLVSIPQRLRFILK